MYFIRQSLTYISLLFVSVSALYAGRLVIVGGALSNEQDDLFESLLASDKPLDELKAAVIPAASSKPSLYGNGFRETLIQRGLEPENVRLLPLAVRDDSSTDEIDESTWFENANDPDIVDWLKQCDLVWFTGGDQSRITAVLQPEGKSTQALDELHSLLNRGGTIGGTSAGAAMMSETMIVGGNSRGALLAGLSTNDEVDQEDGPLLVGEGLGFLQNGIIDQHFDAKARLGRLILATAKAEDASQRYGFGIDENTALVVDVGTSTATVAGASQVIVVSGAALDSNEKPYHLEDIRISSLGPGDSINLSSMAITPADDKSATHGYEYYNIPDPIVSGVMSGYGNLNMLLTRLLLDNKASDEAVSYLFSNDQSEGYRLRFSKDEKSKGFWAYRAGQVDHYTVIDARLDIEPIKVTIESR